MDGSRGPFQNAQVAQTRDPDGTMLAALAGLATARLPAPAASRNRLQSRRDGEKLGMIVTVSLIPPRI
jgi:hypothetical protein